MKIRLLLTALMLLSATWIVAQSRNVSGRVTDKETGDPIVGAAVVSQATNKGVFTDMDGKYTINANGDNDVIIFNNIGYTTVKMTVGGQTIIDVIMESNVSMGELVVTAVGISRDKKAIGYATQEVSGRELVNSRETNLVNSLSSKVAGVQVNSSGGMAGASSFLVIRGQNTILGNNQPLFVIDGIPIDNSQLSSSNPNNGRNGFLDSVGNSNRAIDIPQEDIESVTVLKGAAATALYGSLASGGAIIITTKRGKSGKKGLNINVNSGWEWSQYNKMVPLQNKFAQGVSGEYYGPETGLSYSWGPSMDSLVWVQDPTYIHDRNGYIAGVNQAPAGSSTTPVTPYNNVDNFFRNGFKHYYNVDLSGASDKTDYFLSTGYEHTDGIVPNNSFQKFNVGFNGGIKLTKNTSVRSSVKYIRSGGVRIEQGSNVSGVMLGLLRTPASYDNSNGYGEDGADNPEAYQFADGTQRKYRYGNRGYDNPFWTVNKNPLRDKVNRIIGNVEITQQIRPWLKAVERIGLDFYSDYRNQSFAIGSRQFSLGQVTENNFTNTQVNNDLIFIANNKVGENISFNTTLGFNMFSSSLTQVYVQGDVLAIPDFYDISNAGSISTVKGNSNERQGSTYLMEEFAYKSWLFLTLTGRMGYTTSLPVVNQPYFYPSATVGFVFTDALKMNNKWLSYGKLRGGYSRVDQGTPFLYSTSNYYSRYFLQDGWTDGITFPFAGQSGFETSPRLGDPNLKPETLIEQEVGVELKFLNNRVGIDFTYYNNTSKNLIFPIDVAASTGYNDWLTNGGSIQNKGIELMAYARPVETKTGFTWDINANYTKNTNKVVSLEGVDNVFLGGFEGSSIRAVAGQPYGSIYGFGFYRDASGARVIGPDGYPILDPTERAFGNAQPKWMLGLRNSISYKGFSLTALLDIRHGGVMWNGTRGALYFFGTHADTEVRGTETVFEGNVAVLDADGNLVLDENGLPKTEGANSTTAVLDENWLAFGNGNGFFGNNTEDFIEEISWVRLRELALNYRLPSRMISKTPFTNVEVGITGRNLWLQTNYKGIDPETSLAGSRNEQGMDYFNMPNTKGIGVNLRLSF